MSGHKELWQKNMSHQPVRAILSEFINFKFSFWHLILGTQSQLEKNMLWKG